MNMLLRSLLSCLLAFFGFYAFGGSWIGTSGGVLNDPANWKNGYPDSDSTAQIQDEQTAPLKLTDDWTVKTLNFEGAVAVLDLGNYCLEASGGRLNASSDIRLETGTLKVSGYYLRGTDGSVTLTVNGPAAVLDAGLTSRTGEKNRLLVEAGALARGGFSIGSISSHDLLSVSGAGSRLVIPTSKQLNIGIGGGFDNGVLVSDGAVLSNLSSTAVRIDVDTGWHDRLQGRNYLCVSNASLVGTAAGLYVGYEGSSNRAEVVDGANVSLAGTVMLGARQHATYPGRTGANVLEVRGRGTFFTASAFNVGNETSDANVLRVADDATVVCRGDLSIGMADGAADNLVEVCGSGRLVVSGSVNVATAAASGTGNAFRLDGASMTFADTGSSKFRIGQNASGARLELVNGAELIATNETGWIVVGAVGTSLSNVLRIASGSVLRAHATEIGFNGGDCRLELENGSFVGTRDTRSSGTDYLAFGRYSGNDGELVIKGTNSCLDTSYSSVGAKTRIRFEIPKEGIAPSAHVNLGSLGNLQQIKSLEVAVDPQCEPPTKITHTLMRWSDRVNSDARAIPEGVIKVSGPEGTRLIVSATQIDIEIPKKKLGMVLLVR